MVQKGSIRGVPSCDLACSVKLQNFPPVSVSKGDRVGDLHRLPRLVWYVRRSRDHSKQGPAQGHYSVELLDKKL